MKLLIAIPALNEEKSIEKIIARTLEARDTITADSPVTEVEITVVSDGSTDRTVELAERFGDRIGLIVFPQNRGYGAAIQAAWRQSDAELVGFLDADGTCDPRFFAPLCQALVDDEADIALGNRMTGESKMPLVRRLGNRIFAAMLTVLSSQSVRDTASGMRVLRRSSLRQLMPLPDGLHFTPAMSARAILSSGLKITERDMAYHEREGQSKLRVAGDGLRFLRVILQTAFLHRPSRPLGLLGLLCLAVATGLMLTPVLHYLAHSSVAGWMIYRFVVSDLLGTIGCLLLCAAYLTRRIVWITLSGRGERSRRSLLESFFTSRFFWLVPLSAILAGGLLVLPSFLQLIATGATYEHWSRFIALSFLWSSALILAVTRFVDYSLGLIAGRLDYLEDPGKPSLRAERQD